MFRPVVIVIEIVCRRIRDGGVTVHRGAGRGRYEVGYITD